MVNKRGNRGRGRGRGGRGKPQAHKRGYGGGAGRGVGGRGTRVRSGEGDRQNRRNRNNPVSNNNNNAGGRMNNTAARRRSSGPRNNNVMQPIRVKNGGIMSAWKQPLGGLIRYYVHTRTQDPDSPVSQKAAEEEIDRYYYRNNCSIEDTKTAILEALGVSKDTNQQDWISMDMAIEKNSSEQMNDNIPTSNESNNTIDSKGIKLSKIVRSGEGPAHCHEQWTTVVVPDWAVGQAFFFQVTNNSPLNLSCELFLDGEKVCHNAPIEPESTQTIRPDNNRYYERHQWILNDAKRVKLTTGNTESGAPKPPPPTPRYNGIRPNYDGQRISQESYRDPTTFGWTFTGSVEESRVEFYEKRLNMGIVKLDFYYTTGTMKTVLEHPSSGRNQLFRAQVSPEQYTAILMNPRAHTGQGYRRREDRPTGNDAAANQDDDEDEFDRQPQPAAANEEEMRDDADDTAAFGSTYFAKNESYDFKKQGHQNRVNQMNQLQQSNDYLKWRDANKKEYAVVHAKFYISVPKRRYYAPPPNASRGGRGGHNHQRRGKPREKLQLPEQSTVIDVKAAERATLGTRYKSIGPAQSFSRSRVRMERINGLTDDKHAKGNPLFESKLYYRAEDVINGVQDDSDDMSDGEKQEAVQPPSLAEYKASKIEQVKQYYTELKMCIDDQDDADQLLLNTKNKIMLSESIADVDESVKMFFTDLTKRQIS